MSQPVVLPGSASGVLDIIAALTRRIELVHVRLEMLRERSEELVRTCELLSERLDQFERGIDFVTR